MNVHLFAYGTLMQPGIMARVSRVRRPAQAVTLEGYVRRRLHGVVYPGIRPEPGASVAGRLYLEVPPAAVARLDDFEGSLYLRSEVSVRGADGVAIDAQAYVIAPAYHGRLSDEAWSYEDFVARDLEAFRARGG